jgi:outer membrane murein-binding lipoprotein Lpp
MRARTTVFSIVLLAGGCADGNTDRLAQDNAHLRAELQTSKQQVLTLAADRDRLARQLDRGYREAVRLAGDTAYLRESNVELASAVNRLASEDWNSVVPDVQRTYSDVELATKDMDAHVARVVRALEPRR